MAEEKTKKKHSVLKTRCDSSELTKVKLYQVYCKGCKGQEAR